MDNLFLADVTGVIIGMGIVAAIFLVVTIIQSSRQVKKLEKKVVQLREQASHDDSPQVPAVGNETTGDESPRFDD